MPEYDRERVYPTDIRKLMQWYNLLIETGNTEFTPEEPTEEKPEEAEKESKEKATAEAAPEALAIL